MYYIVGNILDQIVHTRLRLECSSLNEHLFSKTPVVIPNCMCGELETDTHFLFNCPRFVQQKASAYWRLVGTLNN